MSEEDFRMHFPEKKTLFSFYTLKLLLKGAFALAMVALFVVMILRSCTMKGSSRMQSYLWTEQALSVGDREDFAVYSVPAINEASTKATFTMSKIYYTEPIGQFQFLLSYNVSSLQTLSEKYNLAEPAKDGEDIFVFALEDSLGNRYTEYEYVTDRQWVNGFYRLVFTGVPISRNTQIGEGGEGEAITAYLPVEQYRLCVYCKGQAYPDGKKLDELTVWEYGFYKEEIKLDLPDAPDADLKQGITVFDTPVDTEKED